MRITALLALALLAAPAAAQTLVSGKIEYRDKAWDWNGWTGSDPQRPVRRADVHVLNNATQAVLASGTTAQDGSFTLPVNLAGTTDLVVRCDADSDIGTFQRVRVTTENNVEYAVFSAVFPGIAPGTPALDTGTTTALAVVSGSADGGPFNLFDMGIAAAEYIASPPVSAAPSGQSIRLYWPGSGGSFASGNGAHISEDDGYDDAVILHELGHVVHDLYSDSDSMGGSHTFGDSDQDPLLSFGEGYATFFAGTIMDRMGWEAIYNDMNGASQSGGSQLRARIETAAPYSSDSWGAADELAVACTLFDLLDTEASVDATPGVDDDDFISSTIIHGIAPALAWWQVFTGPANTASNVMMNHTWDGWFTVHASDPHLAEMMDVYDNRRMRFWNDFEEPDNDAGSATLQPAVTGSAWSAEHTLYFSSANPPSPGTGDSDWYAVPLVKGDVVDFVTRYPGNASDADTQCDTFLEVFTPGGASATSAEEGGAGRNAKVTGFTITESGTWTYRVRTTNAIRRYGRYETRTRYVSQNHVPVITDGPHASPDTITVSQTSLLTVTASDQDAGQTISYAWTPLDGGMVLGSGSVVTFQPPAVGIATIVRVQLVVTDSLGAQSPPVEVNVTVQPAGSPCGGAASVTAGGTAKPGALGSPVLSAQNLPELPSANFALHATNCFPLKPASLVIGFSLISANFDQGKLYPSPDLMLTLATSAGGEVLLPLTLSSDPLLCGVTVYSQLLVPGDPGAAGPKKTAQTGYLALTFGN